MQKRRVLDLFAGLGGFSSAFEQSERWDVTTVDIEERFDPDIVADIKELTADDLDEYDVILASPPCKAFSVASIGHHWDKEDKSPETEFAAQAIELVNHALELIDDLDPEYWFLENPRGMLRKKIGDPEGTVTWCQYGANRMKPTDLWGDHPEGFEYKSCKNGAPCHESAPRGSKTGTQGVKGSAERAKIPHGLSKSIKEHVEETI